MILSKFKTVVSRWSPPVVSLLIVAATFAGSLPVVRADGMTTKGGTKVTDDQRILHVLNRLGFGARPGDVERVKAVGLDNYIKDRKSTRLNSSHSQISYAVFCLKKKTKKNKNQ